MTRFSLVALVVGAVAGPAGAQAPAAPAPVSPAAVAAPTENLPAPATDFAYAAAGRRDPFQTLARGRTAVTSTEGQVRPSGVAGLLAEELVVRGIVLSNGAYVAMVSGPATGQSFTVKTGARLFDGTVQSITPREVVIVQQVSDPLSLQKQRQVRKALRTQEEGK
jgi:Tfp pilus assembly protein PilP